MSTATAPLTVDQFLRLPEEQARGCELVEGEVVFMGNAGSRHEIVKSNIQDILSEYNRQNRIGKVFSETMYALRESEARQPDVSFLLAKRVAGADPDKLFQGAPELAVEVVSSEAASDLERKVNLYLETGSRAVWVAYPEDRTVRRYLPSGASQRLKQDDYLEEPALLPGFRVQVAGFFEGV
ncbi:MAG: Uma2 family endonuclease [Acidobacteria bacterium]|nr:Uma2 family endonuclease [Acidobacteriota bacterium]